MSGSCLRSCSQSNVTPRPTILGVPIATAQPGCPVLPWPPFQPQEKHRITISNVSVPLPSEKRWLPLMEKPLTLGPVMCKPCKQTEMRLLWSLGPLNWNCSQSRSAGGRAGMPGGGARGFFSSSFSAQCSAKSRLAPVI